MQAWAFPCSTKLLQTSENVKSFNRQAKFLRTIYIRCQREQFTINSRLYLTADAHRMSTIVNIACNYCECNLILSDRHRMDFMVLKICTWQYIIIYDYLNSTWLTLHILFPVIMVSTIICVKYVYYLIHVIFRSLYRDLYQTSDNWA